MKNGFKVLSFMVMGLAVVSSASGCSLSQKKVNANTEAVKDTSLTKDKDDKLADFTVEYSYYANNGDKTINATISKDAATLTYYFTENGVTSKLYSKANNKVYLATGDTEDVRPEGTTAAAFEALGYYDWSVGLYEKYKETPYSACHSFGDDVIAQERLKTPDVDGYKSISCKNEKKVFKKDVTYQINYRLDAATFRYITLTVNRNNKISYLKVQETSRGTGTVVEKVQVAKFSFDDVK